MISDDISDIYFANQMIHNLNVVGVFIEKNQPPKSWDRIKKQIEFFKNPRHFLKLKRKKQKLKKHYQNFNQIGVQCFGKEALHLNVKNQCCVIETEYNQSLNENKIVQQIQKLNPDLILVCGCSILKSEIINIPKKGVLNLHGGLSQVYRGLWTTLWAVVHGEPEYIGATVHYVNEGIDQGDILYQGRPELQADDNPETLYVKVVKLGVQMMLQAVDDIHHEKNIRIALKQNGKLYLKRMITLEVIEKAWEQINSGVLSKYLANKIERDIPVNQLLEGSHVYSFKVNQNLVDS